MRLTYELEVLLHLKNISVHAENKKGGLGQVVLIFTSALQDLYYMIF